MRRRSSYPAAISASPGEIRWKYRKGADWVDASEWAFESPRVAGDRWLASDELTKDIRESPMELLRDHAPAKVHWSQAATAPNQPSCSADVSRDSCVQPRKRGA